MAAASAARSGERMDGERESGWLGREREIERERMVGRRLRCEVGRENGWREREWMAGKGERD